MIFDHFVKFFDFLELEILFFAEIFWRRITHKVNTASNFSKKQEFFLRRPVELENF